jgi:hypothetical protein
MRHAVDSVGAGLVGLDFENDPGDLRRADPNSVKTSEKDFFEFQHRMRVGDQVLIMVHHFPFALIVISGEYNYMAECEPELGVWFRHFRRIDKSKTIFAADVETDARKWERIVMTDTISILRDESSKSYQLIDKWRSGISL